MAKNVILVPVDFGEASRRALTLAKELAAALGAETVLAHVYQIPVYVYPTLGPAPVPFFQPEIAEAARKSLDDLAREEGIAKTLLRDGDAAEGILTAAKELDARMIVMGTHGRGALAHLLLGSVAEKVVRNSPIPVLTVRAPAPEK